MISKNLKQIEKMCLGSDLDKRFADISINGVSTDSRNIKKGQLFIPLVGDNFDGHKFIQSAIESGAAAVLSSETIENSNKDIPTVFVEDTLLGLQSLAQSYIEEISPKIISITGSNGKTSTKDILASLLATQYKTHKTSGNFNNHIGVPLTILEMDTDVEVAVIEMGISDFGDMAELSNIAKPGGGIITNISGVHLDDLLNTENVAKAKMEFLDHLSPGGLYLYFKDDEVLENAAKDLHGDYRVQTFGESEDSDFSIKDIEVSSNGSKFKIPSLMEDEFFLPMIGKHQVYNASAAIAMAIEFDISLDNIVKGLGEIDATGMRNELVKGERFTILDDSYKSNPDSLNAALNTLYSLDGYSQKIAIIGDMLGLGDEIEFIHRDLGKSIDPDKIDMIIGIGYYSEYIIWEAEEKFGKDRLMHFEEKSKEMIKEIKSIIKDNALVLVKASRPLELDTVVKDLLE